MTVGDEPPGSAARGPGHSRRLPALRARHPDRGAQLLLWDSAAPPGQAPCAECHLRLRPAHRRHRRRSPASGRQAGAAQRGEGSGRRSRCLPRRSDARRAGGRRPAFPHSAERVWRTHRRLRRGRARHHLYDLRRLAVLLPLRGRVHRPAVARRLRRHRPAGGAAPRRRAWCRPPADQHPARHQGRSCRRPGLPARGGYRALWLCARPRFAAAAADAGRFADLVRFEAARAREWYSTGLGLLPMLDRRSAACTAAMAGIYRRLLDRIAAAPAAVAGGRTSLPGWEKAWVAARSLAGGLA